MHDDNNPTVLVADRDERTRRFLADNLTADGYTVLEGKSASHTLALAESHHPDLLVLGDFDQPVDALGVLRQVRAADGIASRLNSDLAVVICSGRSDVIDRLRGFHAGCDDYLPKPFSYPELHARVRRLLYRTSRSRTGAVRVGDLTIDPVSREVRVGGTQVDLTAKEFALLNMLASEPTRVFTKEELLRTVWGFRAMGSTRTLDSHSCRLRHKLAIHGGRYVANVWGVGYRLVDDAATVSAEAA